MLCASVSAEEGLPQEAERILRGSGIAVDSAGGWTLERVLGQLSAWACAGWEPPLRFAARLLLYLCTASTVGLAAGNTAMRRCLDAICVLGFGALSLNGIWELTKLVSQTAGEVQTYLAAFVPVYSGVAVLCGQTAGAAGYSGLFLAVSGFLASSIERLILPLLQVYFCFAACSAIWGSESLGKAASLFADGFRWLLKGCGLVFSFVLGLQNVLAGISDSAALRMGKSILSGAVPVVGDAAAAALSGVAASLQLLKGSLAAACVAALCAAFLPVLLQCLLYIAVFWAGALAASACGQRQCSQICELYAQGARLCGAVLILYGAMAVLSTALLLLTGKGGMV